jgi:hypothetical protein
MIKPLKNVIYKMEIISVIRMTFCNITNTEIPIWRQIKSFVKLNTYSPHIVYLYLTERVSNKYT